MIIETLDKKEILEMAMKIIAEDGEKCYINAYENGLSTHDATKEQARTLRCINQIKKRIGGRNGKSKV